MNVNHTVLRRKGVLGGPYCKINTCTSLTGFTQNKQKQEKDNTKAKMVTNVARMLAVDKSNEKHWASILFSNGFADYIL